MVNTLSLWKITEKSIYYYNYYYYMLCLIVEPDVCICDGVILQHDQVVAADNCVHNFHFSL